MGGRLSELKKMSKEELVDRVRNRDLYIKSLETELIRFKRAEKHKRYEVKNGNRNNESERNTKKWVLES